MCRGLLGIVGEWEGGYNFNYSMVDTTKGMKIFWRCIQMEKGHKIQIFVGCLGVVGTILGAVIGNMHGIESQNKYVESQVANVSGEGNTVNMNSVDDLVKNYNKIAEENEKLKEQNNQYFEENTSSKERIKILEDSPNVELKDMGLFINGDDMNINKNNSHAIINGTDYFSEDFINSFIDDNMSITIEDDIMYLGKVVADKTALYSQRVVDEGGCEILDSAIDSYGNTHLNVVRFGYDDTIVYSLNEKYSLLKLKIAIDESSQSNNKCTISILADGKTVKTITDLNKISAKEINCKDLKINNCSRLEIKCTGDWNVYPLLYDAEVYN